VEDNEFVQSAGEVDTDALLQQFESEWTDEETGDGTEEDETDAQEVPGEQGDVESEGGEVEHTEEDNQQNDPDVHKRNEAFKKMREENKELARYKQFVEKMAQDNGFEDPNQIFDAYAEQSLAKEAEERGIDLESMKEIDQLRRQNEEKALAETQQAFQAEREATIEKFNLSESDVQTIHEYVHDNGLYNLGFEQAYKLANFDNLLENARSEGRQKYLADKKQRQQTSAINAGTNNISNSDVSSGDLTDDEFQNTLKSLGISLD